VNENAYPKQERGRKMNKNSRFVLSRRTLLAQGAAVAAASALAYGPAIAQSKARVRMVSINIMSFSPPFIARELGYFDAEGIDAEIIETTSGNQIISSLLGGSADVVTAGFANPSILASQAMSVKHLAGMVMAAEYAIVVRPNIDVPPDDLKALVAALKGKRIGVNSLGTGADNFISGILVEQGVGADWVVRAAVGAGGSAIAALRAGGIDAIITYEPDLTQIVKAGLGKIAVDLRNTKSGTVFARMPGTSLQATTGWVQNNPKLAAGVVRAIVRAVDTLRNDPETSVKTLSRLYPSMDSDTVNSMYNGMRGIFSSEIPKDLFKLAADVYLQHGTIKRLVPYEEVVAAEFAPLWK
jgi:NitT/TauT family transport system substrate-binding protein